MQILSPQVGSHRTSQSNGKITLHALELFVGFDPSIDDADDDKMKQYTAKKIAQVVERTQAYMDKGQNPKLILGHNPDDDDGTVRPAIGDIVSVKAVDINGVPGIVGDIEMSFAVFDANIRTNKFPRRSAEIWSDGYLSEVALLGSQTPARPLPDTKFVKDGLTRESFARHLPVVQFAAPVSSMSEPGPTNVFIPGSTTMADDDKTSELDDLKAKLKAAHEELASLKSKSAAHDHDDDEDDEKMKNTRKKGKSFLRTTEIERDDFARQLSEQKVLMTDLRQNFLAERFNAKLNEMQTNGYRLGDGAQKAALLREIVGSADENSDLDTAQKACEAKLSFMKQYIAKDPVGLHIDQSQARQGLTGDAQEKFDREANASERARDRCVLEGTSDPEKYKAYLSEEMQKTG